MREEGTKKEKREIVVEDWGKKGTGEGEEGIKYKKGTVGLKGKRRGREKRGIRGYVFIGGGGGGGGGGWNYFLSKKKEETEKRAEEELGLFLSLPIGTICQLGAV